MNEYQDQLMEKIDELQQQTRYCLNSYDFHHLNNEMKILREKRSMLRNDGAELSDVLQNFNGLKGILADASNLCDSVDELLMEHSLIKGNNSSSNSNDSMEDCLDQNKENN